MFTVRCPFCPVLLGTFLLLSLKVKQSWSVILADWIGHTQTALDLHTHSASVDIGPVGRQFQTINYFIARVFLPDVLPIYPVRCVP